MLTQWPMLAARDGAMSVYHFGVAMEGIKKSLPSYPTIDAGVDKKQIRIATNLFRKYFPRPEAIRHVVAHSAEEISAKVGDVEIG